MKPAPSPAAERQRRHRDRVRRDVKLALIEINEDRKEALIEGRALGAWDENDAERRAEAVLAALDEWRDCPKRR